jgi:hypothetical protein
MGDRKSTKPLKTSSQRLRWLEAEMRTVTRDRDGARECQSWSAVAAHARQLQALRGEYDTEILRLEAERLAAEAAGALDRELTPQERIERLQAAAPQATDEEIEVFVAEWLLRHKLALEVDEGGVPRLVSTGLRLVR